MNWILSLRKSTLRFYKRRVKAFDKDKAKPITDLTFFDLSYLEEYYEFQIRKGNKYIIKFDEVNAPERLRIKNSRMFAEWMIKKLINKQ